MYVCMYLFMDSGHSRMPSASSGTGMLLTKPYLGYFRSVSKHVDLVSFFFLLYGSLASCLHHLNTETSK